MKQQNYGTICIFSPVNYNLRYFEEQLIELDGFDQQCKAVNKRVCYRYILEWRYIIAVLCGDCDDRFFWGIINKHAFILNPTRICIYILYQMRGEIICPFPNFSGCTVGVWELISNFIPYSIMEVFIFHARIEEWRPWRQDCGLPGVYSNVCRTLLMISLPSSHRLYGSILAQCRACIFWIALAYSS